LSLFAPINRHRDAAPHPLIPQDRLAALRHRAFVVPRFFGGLVTLATVYFMPHGMPSVLEIAVVSWLAAAFVIAYFMSRAGRYESAHVLSALALTGVVTAVAFRTGAIASFASIWLVVVPIEAALSGSRRVVALASTVALGAALFLSLVSAPDSAPSQPMLAVLGIVSALLYATGLALGSEAFARIGFWLNHAEEDRYRLLARNAADVITRHDRHGAVLFASPAGAKMFGAKPNELAGRGLFERVHVADRPAYLKALSDAAATREGRAIEFRARRDAQTFIWIEMRCWPLEAAGEDDAAELIAVMRDVTARKDEEHALEEARAAAERANGAKSRFLATISHELRTPLNAIIGFSEMLQAEDTLAIDAKRRHDYAHLINESGQHLLAVVNDILDMSKIESGNFEIMPEPVELARVIAECCELLALRAREGGVALVSEIVDDLPVVVADKRALHQIMLNLLSNAVKFTNRGGKVSVVARAERCQETDAVVIAVEDTGVGIGEADLARVGEPFFQARSSYDRRHDGTGLGVSIVKGLLALHGGFMAIESHVGEGTRVTVRLPVDCESARQGGALATLRGAELHGDQSQADGRPESAVRKSA
jgi:cell cycle sensor histidine kinase DivJ